MTAAPESPMRMPLKSSSRASVETGLAEKLQLVYGNGAARGADGFDLLHRQAAAGEVDALESRETEKVIAERVHVLRGERLPAKESSFAAEEAVTPSTSTSQRKERLGNAAVSASCIS